MSGNSERGLGIVEDRRSVGARRYAAHSELHEAVQQTGDVRLVHVRLAESLHDAAIVGASRHLELARLVERDLHDVRDIAHTPA